MPATRAKWVTAAMQRAVNASPRDRHRRCNSFHLDDLLSIADWRNSNAAGSDPAVPGASPGSAATFRRVAQSDRAPARHAGGLRCNPGRDDQGRTNRSRNGTGLNPDRRARPAGERDLCSPPFCRRSVVSDASRWYREEEGASPSGGSIASLACSLACRAPDS